MTRQRVLLRRSPVRYVGRVLAVLLAAGLVWYGLMLLLGGAGVAPSRLNGLSGYRTAFDFLSGLSPQEVSGPAQVTAIVAGALVFFLFAYLALKELPRPTLARHRLELAEAERGRVEVEPRALERIAETAALSHAAVTDASARWGAQKLALELDVRRTGGLADTLRQVQEQVRDSFSQHDLPERPIAVTLNDLDRSNKRELS